MGLICEGSDGFVILCIGCMIAAFHCCGRVEDRSERLMRYVRGLEMKGAASLKNQKGKPSGPDAVAWRLLRSLKTLNSEMDPMFWVAVSLTEGEE